MSERRHAAQRMQHKCHPIPKLWSFGGDHAHETERGDQADARPKSCTVPAPERKGWHSSRYAALSFLSGVRWMGESCVVIVWAGGSGIWWGEGDCGRLADRWRMALGNA